MQRLPCPQTFPRGLSARWEMRGQGCGGEGRGVGGGGRESRSSLAGLSPQWGLSEGKAEVGSPVWGLSAQAGGRASLEMGGVGEKPACGEGLCPVWAHWV